MNAQTGVSHEIWPLADSDLSDLPAPARQALARIPAGAPLFLPEDSQTLAVYATVPDISGRPALLVKARIPRRIYVKAVTVERISLISDLTLGVLLLTVLAAAVNTIAIKPMIRLTRQAAHIRATNDLSLRSGLAGTDEVGRLAREFDRLLDRLQQLYDKLEERIDQRTAELPTVNRRLQGEIGERKHAEASLLKTRERLEEMVAERTQQLKRAVDKRRERDRKLQEYHRSLRRLSSRLILAEERERRRVATLLHDHIGQALTVTKLNFDALATELPA
jgi:nitrate/nitrite-specific signal transduction histidine kinase